MLKVLYYNTFFLTKKVINTLFIGCMSVCLKFTHTLLRWNHNPNIICHWVQWINSNRPIIEFLLIYNLHSELQSGYEIEDEEKTAAEIAELITKMKRIYQQESRAKKRAEARAKQSAPKQGPDSKINV